MIASNLTVLVMLWNTGMTAPRRMANKISEPSVYIGLPLSSKPPPTSECNECHMEVVDIHSPAGALDLQGFLAV
jgi:hypothetical protein